MSTFFDSSFPGFDELPLIRYLFHNCRYTELLQLDECFLVDVPETWMSAQLVEPLFEEGVMNLNFLGQLLSILDSSLAHNFVAAVHTELVKAQVRHNF